SRLERARTEVGERIERYDFSHAALGVYDFIYAELCDWYLELVKPRLRAREADLAPTLLFVLTETLGLAHPLIPFETEEIYGHIPGSEGLLAARSAGPSAPVDEAAESAIDRVIAAVQAMRAWRDTAEVKPGATVRARLRATGYEETLEHLVRLARLDLAGAPAGAADAGRSAPDGAEGSGEIVATVPIPGGAIEILAGGELDLEAASRRLARRRAKLAEEIQRAERKLGNDGFVAKAPPQVVDAEREKLRRLQEELAAL
ncbi:MAG TPA: class I tRNA ligase family protein, partial [Solirubrobacteraceae bacterium]